MSNNPLNQLSKIKCLYLFYILGNRSAAMQNKIFNENSGQMF